MNQMIFLLRKDTCENAKKSTTCERQAGYSAAGTTTVLHHVYIQKKLNVLGQADRRNGKLQLDKVTLKKVTFYKV